MSGEGLLASRPSHGGYPDVSEHGSAEVPLLRFADAEDVGKRLHDYWLKMSSDGTAPLARENMAWADMVQFVLRTAAELVERKTDQVSA